MLVTFSIMHAIIVDASCYQQITFYFKTNNVLIDIIFTKVLDEKTELEIKYSYDTSKNQLYMHVQIHDETTKDGFITNNEEIKEYLKKYNISNEYLKMKADGILYDRVLKDWFEGNKKYSKFAIDDLGDFTIVKDDFLK